MTNIGLMQLTMPSDREIAMTRVFDAPRGMVFDAYTKPELLKRWLGVHNGWSLAICEIDLRPGGKYRYVWRGPNGEEMGMGGVYLEVVPGARLAATEIFDQPWYEGEGMSSVTFVEDGGRTTLTLTVLYASKDVRDGVLKSPMAKGVAMGFDMLEVRLASMPAETK